MPNEKDFTEKILFDLPDVFADIFNVLLFGGKQIIKPEDLESDGTVSQLKISSDLHMQERDVSKIWTKGKVRLSLLGIENQTKQDKDMPFRILSYDGAAYKAQVNQHLYAAKLKKEGKTGPETKPWPPYPVVSIVLYFGKSKWKKPTTILECLGDNIPKELKPYVSDYKINVFNIAWLDEETVNMFQSDFRLVADYFVQTRKHKGDYKPTNERIRHVHEFLTFLDAALGDKRFSEVMEDPNFQEHIEKGDTTMCEVLDRVEQKGITKGRAEGREEGRAEGRKEGAIEQLCSLVYQNIISLATGVTESKLSETDFLGWMHKLYPDYQG